MIYKYDILFFYYFKWNCVQLFLVDRGFVMFVRSSAWQVHEPENQGRKTGSINTQLQYFVNNYQYVETLKVHNDTYNGTYNGTYNDTYNDAYNGTLYIYTTISRFESRLLTDMLCLFSWCLMLLYIYISFSVFTPNKRLHLICHNEQIP